MLKLAVKIQLKNHHSQAVIEAPTGTTNLEEFLLQNETAQSYVHSVRDIYSSDVVSFVDEENEDEESEFSKPQYDQDPRDLHPEEYVRCDLISSGSPFMNSLWTSDIFTKRADISPYFFYYSKYENINQRFHKGLKEYREYSSFLFQPVSKLFVIF